jgi:lipopolysaccharide exporter
MNSSRGNLQWRVFSSIRWVTFGMVGKGAIYFLQLFFLARLLNADEFGLMAITLSIIAILQIFSDFGVSNALIHYQVISSEQRSSLFWVNFLSSTLVAIIIFFGSFSIANYYSQPQLKSLLWLSSLTLIINSLGQQIKVMAEKNLQFSVLTKLEVLSSFIGLVFTVGMAYMGMGVFSLVGGTMISAIVFVSLLWIFLSFEWRPAFILNINSIGDFLKFGLFTMANNLINSVIYQSDILIGAKFLNQQSIGEYSLSKELSIGIARVINPIVTRVGAPMMAIADSDKSLIKRTFLKTLNMTASINIPIYAGLFIFSQQVILIVFGNGWAGAAPLLQLLSIWGIFRSAMNPIGSLLAAKGRADLSFKWNFAISIFIIPLTFVGANYGSMGLAISALIGMAAIFLPNWYFLVKPLCGATLNEYISQFIPPTLATILSAACTVLFISFINNKIEQMFLGFAMGIIAYLIFSYWINRDWVLTMYKLIFKIKNIKEFNG